MAMAAKDMEGVLRRDRCVALPTPPHGGASIGDTPHGDVPRPLEKTIPNYLKPTICSSHCTSCHYPKNQQQCSQPSTVPTTAAAASSGKRLLSKPPMQKACPAPRAARTPPLSSDHKPAICKDPGSEKASKPRSLPKATTKAKPVDVQDHAKVAEAGALRSTLPKNRKVEDGPIKGSEASAEPADVVDASKKPRTRARSMSMSSIDLAAGPRKLNLQGGKKTAGNESKATAAEGAVSKRQEAKMGKESPPAKNAVKEEAASKLAARRNKVKALVGAFETAMSLHETEKQPSTQQHEEVAEPVKSRSAAADDGRGLQETKVTPEEKGQNQEEEEEEEEDTAGGQREVGEESKNGPSEEEEEEDNGREGVDSLETRH
ncbi:unnamed protein product [Musa acuminata var. zebrina]